MLRERAAHLRGLLQLVGDIFFARRPFVEVLLPIEIPGKRPDILDRQLSRDQYVFVGSYADAPLCLIASLVSEWAKTIYCAFKPIPRSTRIQDLLRDVQGPAIVRAIFLCGHVSLHSKGKHLVRDRQVLCLTQHGDAVTVASHDRPERKRFAWDGKFHCRDRRNPRRRAHASFEPEVQSRFRGLWRKFASQLARRER